MKNKRLVEDIWRFFVVLFVEVLNPLLLISLALFVSVGYILTLLMPVNVDIWAGLLVFSVLAPVIPLSLRARSIWRQTEAESDRVTWRVLWPLSPMLALLLAFLIMLNHQSLLAIAHIDISFSYVIQAYHGSTPLENIFVAGYPANHYWLFYGLIAAIVRLTSIDTFSVFLVLNFVYLASALLWLARTILALNLAKPRTIYLGIVVIFAFSAVNATGPLSLFVDLLEGSFRWGRLGETLLAGADPRLHNVLVKVYNASAMTPGLTAFTAVLFVCVNILRERVEILSLVLVSASGIASLGVMPVVTLYVVCVLLAGLALTSLVAWRHSSGRPSAALEYIRQTIDRLNPFTVCVWLALSLLLSVPLVQYVSQFTSNYLTSMFYLYFVPTNARITLAASILLLPLVGLQIVFAITNPTRSRMFIALCNVLGLFLALGVVWPHQNQYKLQYLLCMIFALAALKLLRQWSQLGRSFWYHLLRIYVAGLIVLALVNSAYGLYLVVDDAVRRSGSALFEDIHVQSTDESDGRLPALYWIRENTSKDAIVVAPEAYPSAFSLFHERRDYVKAKQFRFTDNIPAYDQRIMRLQLLYDPSTPAHEFRGHVNAMESELPGFPFYAVVEYDDINPTQMDERGAVQVFDSPADMVAVYLLNPP